MRTVIAIALMFFGLLHAACVLNRSGQDDSTSATSVGGSDTGGENCEDGVLPNLDRVPACE